MRLCACLVVLAVLAGCQSTREISRHTLDKLYVDTALNPGVLSSVPKQIDAQASPKVVNWWYAGTSGADHIVVYRGLTWDAKGKPVGEEKRYRISQDALKIRMPFAYSKEAVGWMHLYEAAAGEFASPTDLPTARQAPRPIESNPIRRPDESTLPQPD